MFLANNFYYNLQSIVQLFSYILLRGLYPARYSAMFGKVLIPVSVSEKQNGVSFHKYGNKSFVLFSCEIHKPSISEVFSDSRNGESLPNEPSNTWPKEKKHHVTVTIPKQKFAADARTLDQATWNQTVLGLLLTWYADPFRI